MPDFVERTLKEIELGYKDARHNCSIKIFPFRTTKEVEPLDDIIGQPRAVEALRLGATITSHGYNIFVSGLSGTGRSTTVKKILETVRTAKVTLRDYCYVHNFQSPEQPKLLSFSKGMGRAFAVAVQDAVAFLRTRLPQLFKEEPFQQTRKTVVDRFRQKERALFVEFSERLKKEGFLLAQVQTKDGSEQTDILYVIGDKAYPVLALESIAAANPQLTSEVITGIRERYQTHREELLKLYQRGMEIAEEYKRALVEHDSLAVGGIVSSIFNDLYSQFGDENGNVSGYLEELKNHMMAHLYFFDTEGALQAYEAASSEEDAEEAEEETAVAKAPVAADVFRFYKVNVVLDNSEADTAPVIIEMTPSMGNLFGTIKKELDPRGFWRTDFSHIQAGSLLKADGGYLILNALDVFQEDGVWRALKRLILHHKLEISSDDTYFQISQTRLKPQPININVKIILIGDQSIYQYLYSSEEDFGKMFKVNAVFDSDLPFTDDMAMTIARFVARLCNEENLIHFGKSGVAALVDYARQRAGARDKITLRFSDLADLIREASYEASLKGSASVIKAHVGRSLWLRRWRNGLLDEKLHEQIVENTVYIDTEGDRVGQVNGLTVYMTGQSSFGKPARITASTGPGESGIVNIEREADLSGSIHDKAVLIIAGFLRARFAQERPLTLAASISFEQSYGPIDGDSASLAETLVLLSSLSGVPIRQSIAITGSMNQKGDAQPIGGVNEKIEGFFRVCSARGLTGDQGVVIPKVNIKNLMLDASVVEAIKNKKFHLWAVSSIEEAIAVMMGADPGTQDAHGNWTPGSVYDKIQRRLNRFTDAISLIR